jgi:inosine-uridine nucleoside N-ribohydrolase
MGGHVRSVELGGQELPPGIDYNLCSDPEATVAVLGAGFATTLVTADVTLSTGWAGRPGAARSAGPLARAIAAMTRQWTPVQRRTLRRLGRARSRATSRRSSTIRSQCRR